MNKGGGGGGGGGGQCRTGSAVKMTRVPVGNLKRVTNRILEARLFFLGGGGGAIILVAVTF